MKRSRSRKTGHPRPEGASGGTPGGRAVSQAWDLGGDFYNWRSRYGGMEVSDARRLKRLDDENRRLKKRPAESMLDVATLKEALGKFRVPLARRPAARSATDAFSQIATAIEKFPFLAPDLASPRNGTAPAHPRSPQRAGWDVIPKRACSLDRESCLQLRGQNAEAASLNRDTGRAGSSAAD